MNSVVLGTLAFEVHAVVKDSTNLDPAITAGAVEQEMARVLDSPVRDGDVVSAMPKVVGPCGLRDFRTAMTSASIGILRHVGDPLRQKRLVSKPGLLAELFLGPNQNGLDVLFGGWGDQKTRQRVTDHWSEVSLTARRIDRFVR